MTYDSSKVAFIDTETTGLDVERHGIWDIAVIVDGVEHEWQQLLTPDDPSYWQQDVSPWVFENTRISTDYDYETALHPKESIEKFMELVGNRHLVGACPWFDSERLHRVLLQHTDLRDHPWHYHLIDIENLMVGYMAGFNAGDDSGYPPLFDAPGLPWKSKDLSLAIGIDPDDFEPAHTAITDARWAKACYEVIMGEPRE